MPNTTVLTASETPSEMRAIARDLVARADSLERQDLQDANTRFWDILSHKSDREEGILIEQHEPGRAVEYRVMEKKPNNAVGSEWDSNHHEPKKNQSYPPQFSWKSVAEVRLLSSLTDDLGRELRRYVEV
jgi:hypothetical protein